MTRRVRARAHARACACARAHARPALGVRRKARPARAPEAPSEPEDAQRRLSSQADRQVRLDQEEDPGARAKERINRGLKKRPTGRKAQMERAQSAPFRRGSDSVKSRGEGRADVIKKICGAASVKIEEKGRKGRYAALRTWNA
eukprot:619911-Pleurochrysis_carterae.AAC.1